MTEYWLDEPTRLHPPHGLVRYVEGIGRVAVYRAVMAVALGDADEREASQQAAAILGREAAP
jgi:hypothetical protein